MAYAQLWPSPARRFPVPALRWLAANRVPASVVALREGPFRAELAEVVEVRSMPDLAAWSPAGLVERLLRRGGAARPSRWLHAARLARRARWLEVAGAVHLNSPQAVTVLRYLPPHWPGWVTTYCHPDDMRVRQLAADDRDLLLARTQHFLAADSEVAGELTGEHGVPAGRVTVVARSPVPTVEDLPPRAAAGVRARLGIPEGAWVLAVPAVPDWGDTPDLTLGLAWELARRALPRPVHVLWFGVPGDFRRCWPMEHDVAEMGLANVHLDTGSAAVHPFAWADAAVLPSGSRGLDGGGDGITAAQAWGVPALCWADHPAAGEVAAWTGAVAPALDVDAMADLVVAALESGGRAQPSAGALRADRAAESQQLLALLGTPASPDSPLIGASA